MAMVIGVGVTPFGRQPDRSLADLGRAAALAAIADAGLAVRDLDGAFVANGLAAALARDTTVGQAILAGIGVRGVPVVNVENACTSGSSALWLAAGAVAAGQVERALVLGVEKMCVPGLGLIDSGRGAIDTQLGLVAPASFAMRAMRYAHEFGLTPEQRAAVVVKSRAAGARNPDAMFRAPMTIAAVLAEPVIAEPLTRAECSPVADGAAALVLASDRAARGRPGAIRLDAVALRSGRYDQPVELATWPTDVDTARIAYERAGIGPADLDLVECHDAFSIAEIIHVEGLGLCPVGEGSALAASGATALGGRIPVNVSGGLLSRGHPVAATGVAQVVEIVRQLRGAAGARQVEGARVGLAQCMGGDLAGDTKSCTVAILSR